MVRARFFRFSIHLGALDSLRFAEFWLSRVDSNLIPRVQGIAEDLPYTFSFSTLLYFLPETTFLWSFFV